MVRRIFIFVLGCLLLGPTLSAAEEMTLAALQSGDDEREDAGGACLQETDFLAGTVSAAAHLRIGGDSYGCDSEWATSLEFDLGALPAGRTVLAATLIVRKTGYSDDAAGFAYLGAFAYDATGAPVSVPRAVLIPETALDIRYPPAANVDLSFDVTAAVHDWLDAGEARAGILLAGVYSEVGYEDWISVGGAPYAVPPRLVVVLEDPVPAASCSWSELKAVYR